MKHRIAATLILLDRFVDWFIPLELARNAETRKQARMFLISHILGPFIGNVVPAALYVLDPAPGFDVAILAFSITAFWLFPFILKATGRYTLLALLSIQNLIFCILWSCFFYGGVSSPNLPWVLTIPLLACFYLGSSPALRRTVPILFAANLAAYFGLQVLGLSATTAMPAAALQGLGIVSTSAAALYVAMMASYYAKVLASGVELEADARRHLATAVELRRAAAEAERADAAKAEFLAKMSHELRTPLNAVIGYSQILLEDAEAEGDAATVDDLNKIHGAGQHLLKIVNAVLDLSKIEAGKMDLFVETVDFAALVRSAAERCRKRAADNGTGLRLELDRDLGLVRCDAHKTEQSLLHIIDNAAKFTQGGSILVFAARTHGASGDEVMVAVRDTGIGIPADALPGLFRQFDGVEDATSSKYGGTGVGLALSQKLCRLMGGDVLVESEHGVGSCFTIRLPAGGASPQGEAAPEPRDGSDAQPALAWAA